MDSMLVSAALLFSTGAFVGLLAGLFGVGGGIVMVPAFFMLLMSIGVSTELATTMSIATSLCAILPTSLISAYSHYRLNNVDIDRVKLWLPGIVLGALLGGLLIVNYLSLIFTLFFALLLLGIAVKQLFLASNQSNLENPPAFSISIFWNFMASIVVGFASSVAGIGAGSLGVPIMKMFGVVIHKAVGTCAVLGFFIAFPSVLIFLYNNTSYADTPEQSFGLIYLPALIFVLPGVLLFTPLGAKFNARISARRLNLGFGVLLLFVSGNMLWAFFRAL